MPKVIHVDFKGSVTSPNTLERPVGSLRSSVNCIIETPGVLRKGPCLNTTATSTVSTQVATGYVHSVQPYADDKAIVAYNGTADADAQFADTVKVYSISKASSTGSLTSPTMDPTVLSSTLNLRRWSKYSTIDVPTGKMNSVPWGKSVYFTSGFGLRKIDFNDTTYYHRHAGVPKAIINGFRGNDWASIFSADANGIYAIGYGAAYRAVVFFEYEDGRRIYGAPTDRHVCWNRDGWQVAYGGYVAAQANYNLRFYFPTPLQVETNYTNGRLSDVSGFFGMEIYRSEIVNITGGAWPSDIMNKISEVVQITDAVSRDYVDFTDKVSDSSIFKGIELYTNSTVGGPLRAKNPPPNFSRLASWGGRLWGACYTEKPSIVLTMVGTPSTNDTITFTHPAETETYTFISGGAPATDFEIELTGLGTADQRRFWIMQNLVTLINENNLGLNAYMVSAGPGQTLQDAGVSILLETKATGDIDDDYSDFTITFSSDALAKKFRPYSQDATSNELTVKHRSNKNTVWCSEANEPDAWPPDDRNAFKLGEDNMEILAMHPLEEGLYIFTTRGLYIITGSDETNFRADLVDETAVLVGDECVARADGALWAWLHKGFAQIKNGRTTYVSQPIQDQLDKARIEMVGNTVAGDDFNTYKPSFSFAASDSKNDRVYLFLPNPDDFS